MKQNNLSITRKEYSFKEFNLYGFIIIWLTITGVLYLYLGSYLDKILIFYNIKYLRKISMDFTCLCFTIFYLKYLFKRKRLNIKGILGSFTIPCKEITFFTLFFIIVEILLVILFDNNSVNSPINFYDSISLIFIMPIMEEIIFRGILFTILIEKFGIKISILIITLIFVCFHGDSWKYITLSGFYLGYIYYKTKSLYASIFTHILHNTVAIIISFLFDTNQITRDNFSNYRHISIILIVLLTPLVIFFLKKFWDTLNDKKESIYMYNCINR